MLPRHRARYPLYPSPWQAASQVLPRRWLTANKGSQRGLPEILEIFFHHPLDIAYYHGSIFLLSVNDMNARPLHRLGELQLKIMKVLWERQEATVIEVHQAVGLAARLAFTTIATMLRKMEVRGLVRHRKDGRTFVYCANIAEDDVTRKMAGDLLDRLFEGSLTDMVSHLLTTREVSRQELNRLEKLIAERKKVL